MHVLPSTHSSPSTFHALSRVFHLLTISPSPIGLSCFHITNNQSGSCRFDTIVVWSSFPTKLELGVQRVWSRCCHDLYFNLYRVCTTQSKSQFTFPGKPADILVVADSKCFHRMCGGWVLPQVLRTIINLHSSATWGQANLLRLCLVE
jgi:hypothetical protein